MTSAPPPAANETTMVTGRCGQSCAAAGTLALNSAAMGSIAATRSAARPKTERFAIMLPRYDAASRNRQGFRVFPQEFEPGQFAGQDIELCYHYVLGDTEPGAPW